MATVTFDHQIRIRSSLSSNGFLIYRILESGTDGQTNRKTKRKCQKSSLTLLSRYVRASVMQS